VLIAVLAVIFWAGLNLWSPTRRLGPLLRADQPAYVRREAAMLLGHEIPFWEVDRALSLLKDAQDDPSPRVRESALAGLWQLGTRSEPSVPAVINLLKDDDRYVRFMAAKTLGQVAANSPKRAETLAAVGLALGDRDADVRLAAAESVLSLGESEKAAALLIPVLFSTDPYLHAHAQQIIRRTPSRGSLVSSLAHELRSKDKRNRERALETLLFHGTPETVRQALLSALDDKDPEIRRCAASKREKPAPAP
jgi:HEAT repeat protein